MEMLLELHPAIHQQGVLVVDDSPAQRRALIESLRWLGVGKIFEAGDGQNALQVLRRLPQPPAIIVLDLEMPGMDGIEMAQQLALEGLRPSVLLASSADKTILDVVQRMIEALGLPLLGALRKPLTDDAIAQAMVRFGCAAQAGDISPTKHTGGIDIDAFRRSIDLGHIEPNYQPKVGIENGSVVGLEALARWRDENGTAIPPTRFIEFAERNGLINQITLVMLDAVLRDMMAWHQDGFHPTVAVNISASSLADRSFASEIINRIDAARIPPSALVLEITESALVGDLAASLGTLARFRLKGYGLSIDDYGTGFSSMQQLSQLPFTELKIDRSFVRHADEKWQLRTILESALRMGCRLGLTTVAEGVETQEELNLLRALGCNYAQGYLISPPMPGPSLLPWIGREQQRLHAICTEQPLS